MVMSKSTSINEHVGSRIRVSRNAMSMPIQQLSEALGVTVQQLEEYEAGSRRVGAADLLKISETLRTPPSFFFEGFSAHQGSLTEGEESREQAQSLSGGFHLIRIFTGVKDAAARKKIIDFAASIANQEASKKTRTPPREQPCGSLPAPKMRQAIMTRASQLSSR